VHIAVPSQFANFQFQEEPSTVYPLRQPSLKMKSTLLREIAALSNPNPVDFDPEDIAPDVDISSDEAEEGDVEAGREHYLDVRYLSEHRSQLIKQ
jgi:hypothetical protein